MNNAVITFDSPFSARRGLSLLEVLAATFVLMIGLLGMMAIIPFGLYQVSRINQADFGGNLGQTAIEEIKIRQFASGTNASLFDPYERVDTDTTITTSNDTYDTLLGVAYTAIPESDSTGAKVNFIRCDVPFIVDPLAVESHCNDDGNPNKSSITTDLDHGLGVYITGTAANPDSMCYFPYGDSNGMPRITCELTQPPLQPDTEEGLNNSERGDYPGPYLARPFLAEDIFYSHEDRVFAAPALPASRTPRPVGVPDGRGGVQTYGGYSWLYMVTPQNRGARYHIAKSSGEFVYIPDTITATTPPGRHTEEAVISGYDVDIVVFFNRNIDPSALAATERTVTAVPTGTGYRGGPFKIASTRADDLDLTDTKYILLSSRQNSSSDPLTSAKWYHVVNFGEIRYNQNRYERDVMLTGRDVSTYYPDDTPISFHATIARGVIRVYSVSIAR